MWDGNPHTWKAVDFRRERHFIGQAPGNTALVCLAGPAQEIIISSEVQINLYARLSNYLREFGTLFFMDRVFSRDEKLPHRAEKEL